MRQICNKTPKITLRNSLKIEQFLGIHIIIKNMY